MKRTILTVQPLFDNMGLAMQIWASLWQSPYGTWGSQVEPNDIEQDERDWLTKLVWQPPTDAKVAIQHE
jgi:hypothetical protein